MDPEGKTAIREAMIAVRGVITTADEDPQRPAFHFRPPARWTNDPNGPIFHDGWHHIFYQHNPYADGWGNMHWGHARSRDLVNWEHLPIALWPSKSRGEHHVYSGSAALDGNGKPVIFYTSIGHPQPEQWLARPLDNELLAWEKVGPVVTTQTHAPTVIDEWRDPYIVAIENRTIMLCGGRKDGRGVVNAYEPLDPERTKWKFLGIFFTHPSEDLIECPNLVQIGEQWVLFTSWGGRIDSFVGQIDSTAITFKGTSTGVVAAGSYASQVSPDADGNPIFYSWINVGGAVGWTGCFALPCRLNLDAENHPTLTPIPALQDLRDFAVKFQDLPLNDTLPIDDIGPQIELILDLDPGTATRIELELAFSAPDQPSHRITFDPATRTLTTPRGPTVLRQADTLRVHLFLDHVVMDLFADGGRISQAMALSREPQGTGIRLHSIGGQATIKSLEVHRLSAAKFDLSKFR